MKSLDNIAEDLFNKIRGRFPSVTIGDENGKVTNDPLVARFFDFDYKAGDRNIGKVSISVSEEKLAIMYSNSFVENEDDMTRDDWYNFLKELRIFAKKRLLQFDTRDITKSNLDKRDYKFLAQQHGGEQTMSESKMYGTSKISYQDVGNARLTIKHTESVNQELKAGRTQKIGAIYVENADGERFKYPYKHLNGARAMARHVAEGGTPYDDFGKHVVGLSEELSKLRKFKSYMGRSTVMAEGLADYLDVVIERITTVKKTIQGLQKESFYKESFESFESAVMEDVPSDVAENWIDQLTIKQFNEELQDVFPYIYKLVSEASKADEITPEDLTTEEDSPAGGPGCWDGYKIGNPKTKKGKDGKRVNNCVPEEAQLESEIESLMGQFAESSNTCESCGCEIGNPKPGCTCTEDCKSTDEGNAFAKAVRQAKMDGKKTGDEIDGPDGEKIKLEKEQKTPLGEFILSYYDREEGSFPKGETAILTMVEKDYGEQYINPAKSFIEAINTKFEEFNGYKDPELMDDDNLDNLIKTGVSGTYDFIEKTIKDYEELIRNNPNHPKVPQVKAELAKLKPQLAQARKDSGMGEETNDIMKLAGL